MARKINIRLVAASRPHLGDNCSYRSEGRCRWQVCSHPRRRAGNCTGQVSVRVDGCRERADGLNTDNLKAHASLAVNEILCLHFDRVERACAGRKDRKDGGA